MASSNLEPAAGVVRPVVFFDIQIGETPAGRIKMGTSCFTPLMSLWETGPYHLDVLIALRSAVDIR